MGTDSRMKTTSLNANTDHGCKQTQRGREQTMKPMNQLWTLFGTWMSTRLGPTVARVGLVGLLAIGVAPAPLAQGQVLADYTSYPVFLSQVVPPNILFIVDLGNNTIPAAYSGPGHKYPISFKAGTATDSKYASNVTFNPTSGPSLVAVDEAGASIATATTTNPADKFDPTRSYYGIFDPLRCYGTNSNSFVYGSVKATVSSVCGITHWDGNFMNWMGVRKKDVAYQALVGGTSLPASANTDGTANSLASEGVTGENGTNNTCASNTKPCWRYVKFVPDTTLIGRVPTALPNPSIPKLSGGNADPGRWFGSGEGTFYVNDNGTPDPFDTAAANKYNLKVDLTTEPDVPSGTGSASDHCNIGQTGYAGWLVCYKRDRSLGLFQTMRTDNMRVAVMFVNALSGQGGKMQFLFDESFNSSSITQIRNQHIQEKSPLAEALYEGLCYFRKSQGPCYSNSGSSAVGYTSATGVQGDAFWFTSTSQFVPCCKSFVLMVAPGNATFDGGSPTLQQPFGDLFAGADTIGDTRPGADGGRLDNVAYFGKTNDVRPNPLTGTQNVTFYAVNALGDATGASLLASAAKWGGFEDRNSNNVPEATGQTCTYPAGSNLGTGTSTSSLEWDLNQDCIPDNYFSASEGGDLKNQINLALADILKKSASGTSVSVLATSSTGEGTIYQAFFFPSQFEGLNEIKYTGYTQGLFVDAFGNLREDTVLDGKLVLEQDLIVKTRFDTATNDVKVDRFQDLDGNGAADTVTPFETVGLKDIKPIWEAGRRLALRDLGSNPRKLQTWVDADNNGTVNAGELIDFSTANSATLAPYLRAGAAPFTADNIINFIHGNQITGLRNRQMTITDDGGASVLKPWRYGDPVSSTPTVVAAPKERYDVIYGDDTYATFFQTYKDRRQVAYVGANDGMLHAFNGGYYHRGDDPATTTVKERGFFTRTPTNNSSGPLLGEELFGFIPYQLLPHLQWLARTDYTHVYYVDLKPRVTDVRIFTPDADHPGGWGTILIGGMRLGGSCGSCVSGTGAPPMTVTADFGSGIPTTRTFYSAYFVLDITNPESTSYGKMLWSFTAADLGLTTSYPTIVRVNPASQSKTDNSQAEWFIVVGSGPTGYDGITTQIGKTSVLKMPKNISPTSPGSLTVTTFSTGVINSFMGDVITLDSNLDYRVDAIYLGSVIDNGAGTPKWIGRMNRLTTKGGAFTNPSTDWGISGGSPRQPTILLSEFGCSPSPGCTGTKVGPITAAPTVTLDDAGQIWLFFGTGRFMGQTDKTYTATQYFYGVKDPVVTNACVQTTTTSCERKDLVNVTAATVCVVCASGTDQVTGVTGVTTFDGTSTTSLVGLVASKEGWYVSLASSERSLSTPTILGGTVFFTSFIPSGDVCVASGDGYIYALFYKTGSAYKESVIGTETSGGNTNVSKKVSLGTGLPSQMAVQIGGQGSGASGTASGSGCAGRITGFIQASTGALNQFCGKPALSSWSRYISWLSQRT